MKRLHYFHCWEITGGKCASTCHRQGVNNVLRKNLPEHSAHDCGLQGSPAKQNIQEKTFTRGSLQGEMWQGSFQPESLTSLDGRLHREGTAGGKGPGGTSTSCQHQTRGTPLPNVSALYKFHEISCECHIVGQNPAMLLEMPLGEVYHLTKGTEI